MKRLIPVVLALALIAIPAARSTPRAGQSSSTTPTITGKLVGSRAIITQTPQDSCTSEDVPDAMARAFRDYTGTIHFVTASSTLYQSLGPTLDSLQHSCQAAFVSKNNPDPAAFNDQAWLDSFYTLDGYTIAALSHTEYHGWSHPGECHTQNIGECEYDSDTFHLSTDGGFNFKSLTLPKNFLAGIPYQYKVDSGPEGYSVDSNVINYGGYYYAVATAWTWPPNCNGSTGPQRCITTGGAPLRTTDFLDPSSWRAWSGTDFSIQFADPYPGPVANPEKHVFTAVPYMFAINAINIYQPANVVVATLWDYWDNELGPPGLYVTTSTDLVNWTKPRLVATLTQITANDPPGSYTYAYFSPLDPAAPDLNFSVIGDTPYIYFVRIDNSNSSFRVLYRQQLQLTLNE
jgi:hypothetical protein